MSSPQVALNPSLSGAKDSSQVTELPELNQVNKERGQDGATQSETEKEQTHLPEIHSGYQTKAEKLLKLLCLAGVTDEVPTGALIRAVKMEIMAALEELRVITTHDDNLERQYRETVAENTKLQMDLDKARREIRHLKGQLSVLQMTPAGIREERARIQQREKRKEQQEKKIKQHRQSQSDDSITVLTAAERARTVDANGEYIDHHTCRHTRRSTYPSNVPSDNIASISYGKRKKLEPLPPVLMECNCSACNSKQSFGALTLGKGGTCSHTMSQLTRSGQQVLLGDRVVIKAERLGSVCYIGRLDFDPSDTLYIGVHLDLPIGNCDGLLKGRRYFHCPPNHGVFVRASDIICVTGRKPLSGGTMVPRIRERLPTGLEISRSTKTPSKTVTPVGHASTATSSITMSQVRNTVESEMAMLNDREPEDLTDPSAAEMSRRMKELALKQQRASQEAEEKPTEFQTPPQSPAQDHPPVPTSQPDTTAEPTARTETPLERTLLELLSDKDLGATGFVTASELSAVLASLPENKALNEKQIQTLFAKLGIDAEEGLGIAYHALVPYIMQVLQQ